MTEINRRAFLGLTAGTAALLGLSACSSGSGVAEKVTAAQAIDPKAFKTVLDSGPVADAAAIAASPWAKAIKEAGSLKWGGVDTNALFSIKDVATGAYVGFDAGIAQLLARYIVGDAKVAFTGVTSDTRETLLINNTVDIVVATYSITPARKEKIAFAGPYYKSGAAVLVKADSKVTGIADLDGKKIIAQSGSSTIKLLQTKAPKAELVLFANNEECVAGLKQGRGDAYVVDLAVLMGVVRKDTSLKIVGEPFSDDPYGIGLNKEKAKEAQAFVNGFLAAIEKDGTWAKLWQATLGTVVKGTPPQPPAIEG